MDNIKCKSFTYAAAEANNWVSGGRATIYEIVQGKYSLYVRDRVSKSIIREYSW